VPPPSCNGDQLVTYTASVCAPTTGKCENQSTTTSCPFGCQGGACQTDSVDENVCSGPFKLPITGPLVFSGGTKKTYTRSCDAFGNCSAWVLQTSKSVEGDNGNSSFALYPDGSVSLWTQIGWTYSSQSGSDTYYCKNLDIGSGKVNPTTGLGTGQMQANYHCDIAGGSGGPYGYDPYRAVNLRLGTTCLAVADADPNPKTAYGTQTKSVITLTW
jgi:hypothetical protein